MRRLFCHIRIGAVIFSLVALLAGCGKKDDPQPVLRGPSVTINAVKKEVIEEGILLRWSVQDHAGDLALFKVFRSDPPTCFGCPRDYRLLDQLPLGDKRLSREGEKEYRYVDRAVVKGGGYEYRVVACDSGGRCSAASPDTLAPQDHQDN